MAPVERHFALRGQAVVELWVQIFHHLPPSFQGLVCTRWHCNNTCYTTPFISKINPYDTETRGVILECSRVSVFILSSL